MPLRAFWTIVMEGRPTAFRSPRQEELLPTLTQLRSRHPDTQMMWFQNGRYWRSPLDVRRAREPQGRRGPQRDRGPGRGAGHAKGRRR
jgi:hypothetical protein